MCTSSGLSETISTASNILVRNTSEPAECVCGPNLLIFPITDKQTLLSIISYEGAEDESKL